VFYRLVLIATLLAITQILASCGSTPRVEALMPTPLLFSELNLGPLDHIPENQRWKPRRVYYATTRARVPDLQRIDYHNDESDSVSVGLSLVGFGGPDISWAELNDFSRSAERPKVVPLSIDGLIEAGRFVPSAERGADQVEGAAAWLMADLNASIEAARDRDLLIYVHGAKVNFYNANAFAAQLDHFMGRDMTSLAFSWPTRQNIVAYGTGGDVRRAYRSAPALTSLLEILAQQSKARRIHIICWSAGGRLVNAALAELHIRHADSGDDLLERFRIGTVYFAAADVPSEEFLDNLDALDALAQRIVVTVSSNDGALKMARTFMRGSTRIGQRPNRLTAEARERLLASERLEVVDVSRDFDARGFDITGHRYWIEHPWASTDTILSVRSDLDPEERGLEPSSLGILWSIPADYPERLRDSLTREDLRIRRD